MADNTPSRRSILETSAALAPLSLLAAAGCMSSNTAAAGSRATLAMQNEGSPYKPLSRPTGTPDPGNFTRLEVFVLTMAKQWACDSGNGGVDEPGSRKLRELSEVVAGVKRNAAGEIVEVSDPEPFGEVPVDGDLPLQTSKGWAVFNEIYEKAQAFVDVAELWRLSASDTPKFVPLRPTTPPRVHEDYVMKQVVDSPPPPPFPLVDD